jgi:hypothetical protein
MHVPVAINVNVTGLGPVVAVQTDVAPEDMTTGLPDAPPVALAVYVPLYTAPVGAVDV